MITAVKERHLNKSMRHCEQATLKLSYNSVWNKRIFEEENVLNWTEGEFGDTREEVDVWRRKKIAEVRQKIIGNETKLTLLGKGEL
jgi:hypothetical protein